jgi:hypothetical protein
MLPPLSKPIRHLQTYKPTQQCYAVTTDSSQITLQTRTHSAKLEAIVFSDFPASHLRYQQKRKKKGKREISASYSAESVVQLI